MTDRLQRAGLSLLVTSSAGFLRSKAKSYSTRMTWTMIWILYARPGVARVRRGERGARGKRQWHQRHQQRQPRQEEARPEGEGEEQQAR